MSSRSPIKPACNVTVRVAHGVSSRDGFFRANELSVSDAQLLKQKSEALGE